MKNFERAARTVLPVVVLLILLGGCEEPLRPLSQDSLAISDSGASFDRSAAERGIDIVKADSELYSGGAFGQTGPHGYVYLNNIYGRGKMVNGRDYSVTMKAVRSTFPNGALIEWRFNGKRDEANRANFCYGYPEIFYGGGPFGMPARMAGPWPRRVRDLKTLTVSYDVSLGGNTNSFNVLLDLYTTTTPDVPDGSSSMEISFYPHLTDPHGLTDIVQFSFGKASVTNPEGHEIMIRPVDESGSKPRSMTKATVDLKEILDYLASRKLIDDSHYLRGAEFGVEPQLPNSYNSAPYAGSMLVNRLSYDWH